MPPLGRSKEQAACTRPKLKNPPLPTSRRGQVFGCAFFGSALNGSHREKQPVDCQAFTTTLHLQQADLTFAGVLRALRTGG